MEGKDNIKELFSQKLGNYEAQVNPELWAKIASQVAAGATSTVASGLSVLAKIVIGVGVSAAVITTIVLLNTSKIDEAIAEQPSIKFKQPTGSVPEVNKDEEQNDVAVHPIQNDNSKAETSPVSNTPTKTDIDPKRRNYEAIDHLDLKGSKTLKGSATEHTVVRGVNYLDITKYIGSPTEENETVYDPVVIQPKPAPIEKYVNVFSPNGDGTNDYFKLKSEGLVEFSVVVMNSNGAVVYKNSDSSFSWDGRDVRTGKMVPSGNYMYMVSAYDAERNPYPIYERLSILY